MGSCGCGMVGRSRGDDCRACVLDVQTYSEDLDSSGPPFQDIPTINACRMERAMEKIHTRGLLAIETPLMPFQPSVD